MMYKNYKVLMEIAGDTAKGEHFSHLGVGILGRPALTSKPSRAVALWPFTLPSDKEPPFSRSVCARQAAGGEDQGAAACVAV